MQKPLVSVVHSSDARVALRGGAYAEWEFRCKALVDSLVYLALSYRAFYTKATLVAYKLMGLLLQSTVSIGILLQLNENSHLRISISPHTLHFFHENTEESL